MSALFEIASLATRTDHAGEALARALRLIADDLGAQSGGIALISPDSGNLEAETTFGLPPDDPPVLAPGHGLPGWAVFHGKPALAASAATDPRYRAFRPGVLSQIAAPLFSAQGQALGVIFLERDQAAAFTPQDLERLGALAEQTASVLGRLWELEHLRSKARQLETLLTTGQTLVAKLEEQELFDTLTRDALQLMQGRAAALYLFDATADTVRVVSHAGAPDAALPPADELPASSCAIAAALHSRKPLAIANLRSGDYHDVADIPPDAAIRSMLAAPLNYEGGALGALAVFLDRPHRFDNDEKRLCSALASLGSVALQNARLYSRVFLSEESLRKNERLTTLGLLAAEIAHEIRNPLTVLKLLHGGLGLDFPEGDPRRTDMRVIAEKLDQLEAIVTRVLSFGQGGGGLHTRVSLAEIVEDTLLLVRLKLAQNKVVAHFQPPAQALVVDGHKGQLHQALLNLVLNAMQAMPDGGEIFVHLEAGMHSGHPAAILDVSDTGSGVPEEIRSRIFDSFLSGKPGGTGLGLAIVKRVVQSHRGDIELLSTPGSGAKFRITLPLAKN